MKKVIAAILISLIVIPGAFAGRTPHNATFYVSPKNSNLGETTFVAGCGWDKNTVIEVSASSGEDYFTSVPAESVSSCFSINHVNSAVGKINWEAKIDGIVIQRTSQQVKS
jgi:hypothetical protein